MLSAEESGRQTSQFCIAYNSIISRVGDKLSEEALKVLRANLILCILRFKTNSYESVKEIFNAMKNEYISKKSLSLATVFLVYPQHPYGLCEEVIMLLIAVLIANMNYGTKISYKNNVYSISDWKGVLTSDRKTITENERKRIISIVKESALIQVDAGAVEEKFLRILDTIDVNKSLKSFSKFETELNELISKESVPQV